MHTDINTGRQVYSIKYGCICDAQEPQLMRNSAHRPVLTEYAVHGYISVNISTCVYTCTFMNRIS